MTTSIAKPAKSTPQYLSRKEAFRLWFECLTRAANNPQFTINTAYYKEWGDWRQLSFNEWWGTVGKALLIAPADSVAIACWRRSNIDHLCRLNFDQGLEPAFMSAGCG
jgi:hypothetical protein